MAISSGGADVSSAQGAAQDQLVPRGGALSGCTRPGPVDAPQLPIENVSTPATSSWHFRGYLPHFDDGVSPQFVTFRLADSLPHNYIDKLDNAMPRLPDAAMARERRRRIEAALDGGAGTCWLNQPRIATLVRDALQHFDGERYHLHAWVLMPNHVHVLLTPTGSFGVGNIVRAWKSFTAKAANQILNRTGQFWQADYFDRAVRDERHFAAAVAYIEGNPARAGLCGQDGAWPWSSAACRPSSDGRPVEP